MKRQFMPDATYQERLEVMRNTADKVRDEDYWSELTPEELDQKREEFAHKAIELNKIEERKKDAMELFKEEMKPVKEVYNALLQEITVGKEQKSGRLFDMADHENNMMDTFDENGDLVSSRRLTPEEKRGQSKMFIPLRTGTEG